MAEGFTLRPRLPSGHGGHRPGTPLLSSKIVSFFQSLGSFESLDGGGHPPYCSGWQRSCLSPGRVLRVEWGRIEGIHPSQAHRLSICHVELLFLNYLVKK